jgi:hypothetical protein
MTPEPAGLYGVVWADVNSDALKGPEEEPVDGAYLELWDGQGRMLTWQQTLHNGLYAFTNLEGGEYQLVERNPPHYMPATHTWRGQLEPGMWREVNFAVYPAADLPLHLPRLAR